MTLDPKGLEDLNDVLDRIEEYFDERSDADQEPGDAYPVPNEEMGLLIQLRRERARLSACLANSKPTDWMPVKTAPKDGRKVDLWVRFESGWRRVADAHWNDELGNWQLGEYNASNYLKHPEITHWMPLPEPPALEDTP